MPALFLSYRRGDSPDTVKLICERLKRRLPRWDIFYDHDSIPLGEQFPERLRAEVASAAVVLVIIGPRWLEILHERKDAAVDHVRAEVRLALEANTSVVPVLVGNARMPADADLADFVDLQPLLERNGRPVRPDPDFDGDLEAIVAHIKQFDSDEAIGATLADKYTLTAEVGHGGMGVVYCAEQKQPVKRTVAVKLIKPGMDSRDVLARFDAERQALAVMDHPNIAKVHDAGLTAQGRPFFVMEYVKGVPITQYCDEKKLSPQERLNLFIPVCNAVQHAHQKGIIHRDLKPTNVLIEVIDGQPVPKVIDFGLAKALGHKLTDKTLYPTGLDRRIGTLEYAAPEQTAGKSDVDTRSDIYSLGVMLYELLTGAPPFTHEQLLQIGDDEMRRVIQEVEPAKPSKKLSSSGDLPAIAVMRHLEPSKLTRLVQGDLDWIVMKCLEKERERRYKNANDIGEELQRFLADEPVQAGPPSAMYRLRKFIRRHKAGLLTTAAVLLAVLLAAGGVGWAFWDRAAHESARRVELAGRTAETEKAVTVALTKAQQSEERAKRLPSTSSVEAKTVLVEWREAAASLAEAEATLRTGVPADGLRERVTDMGRRIETGRMQAQRKEKLFHDLDDARMARATNVEGNFDYAGAVVKYAAAFAAYGLDVPGGNTKELARQIAAAEPEVRDLLLVALDDWALAAVAQTPGSANDIIALVLLADKDKDSWRLRAAAAIAKDWAALRALSVEAQRSSWPPSRLELLAAGLLNWQQGGRDEALALLRWGRSRYPTDFFIHLQLGAILDGEKGGTPVEVEEAIGCCRAALALRPSASAAHNNLGHALNAKKQWDEAIAEYRKAIELDPKHVGSHNNLGVALRDNKQLDEAIAEYRKAIELDPKYAYAHSNLGIALRDKKQLDEAVGEYRKAIELDPKFAAAHSNLGIALHDKKQLDDAIAEFRKAIELDPKYAGAHSNLGSALYDKKQLEEAIDECRKAIELDPKFAVAYYNLGNALKHKDQWDEAIAAFRKAIEIDPEYMSAHNNLGAALQARNQLDEAIAELRKAIEIDPMDVPAHFNLGKALKAKNRQDDAIAEFTRAIALDPSYAPAHIELGLALADKNQLDDAIGEYNKAIALDPKDAVAHCSLGLALKAKNQQDEAIAEYRKAIELDRKYATAHNNLGAALHDKNKLDDAIAEYREAIALDPKHTQAHNNLGLALAAMNQLDEAIAEYQKAIEIGPKNANTHYNLGSALRRRRQLDEAIAECRKAIEIDPKYLNAYIGLGNTLVDKKQLDEAIAAYHKALELDPKNAKLYRMCGEVQRLRRAFDLAIADYDQAVRLEPNHAPTYFSRGFTRYLKGDHDGAIADHDQAIRWDAKFALAYNARGLANAANGSGDKALADYNRATELEPKLLFPFYNRGELYRSRREYAKAIDEYTKAIGLNGKDVSSWGGRAQAHAELGQWDKAAADFGKATELVPGDASRQFMQALMLQSSGDKKGYRVACANMLERFRRTADPSTASLVAWAGVLVPGAVDDVRPHLELVAKATAANPENYAYAYTLGAALYRAGRFEDAERQLVGANKLHRAGGTPYDWLLLAMTHARLGHGDEAKKWLEKAVQRIEKTANDKPKEGTPEKIGTLQARLEFQLLRREAEALMKGPRP